MKPPLSVSPFRVYIKRLSFIIRLSGGFVVDILNAFFQEHVGDHRHNNLEISERGGELGGGDPALDEWVLDRVEWTVQFHRRLGQ